MKKRLVPLLLCLALCGCGETEKPPVPARADTAVFAPELCTEIAVGQQITLEHVRFCAEELGFAAELREGYCTVSPPREDLRFCCLRLQAENLSDTPIALRSGALRAAFLLEGQHYRGNVHCFSASELLPAEQYTVYVFAAVPAAAAHRCPTVEVQLSWCPDGREHRFSLRA